MEQQSRLKQRLVGAIVLVALGVIFIPMILNGEREQDFIVNGSSIPARPAEIENIRQIEFDTDDRTLDSANVAEKPLAQIRIPVDERSAALSPVNITPASEKNVVEKKPRKKRVVQKPVQKETGKAGTVSGDKSATVTAKPPVAKKKTASVAPTTLAWAVQVGSFKQKNNALNLRDKLRKQKYKAFVEALRSSDALIYRVRLGPYVNRTGAEQVRDKLLVKQNMKGLVVKHP
ncbi:hypothetical protein MNBD_GAMMA25-1647 [hydrothermal vent metagenome]|uniref:SPOR domain-containing protein n=1 Tax=hydrothermal vent metagenome TaxID=652676 RepID=A0A3B1AYK1_9ZZZZ